MKTSPLKKSWILALGAVLLFAAIAVPRAAKAVATADYYRCVARVGGEYQIGRAPSACNASSFGDDRFIESQFSSFIFSDPASRTNERLRYAQEMNSFIREAAAYYIKKRKPSVSATEVSWWTLAVLVTASHESRWSQYRRATDAKLKLMRGDYGHGHGMMQIDDRAHFPAITNGTAWNLIGNISYAMDILYPHWVKAPSQSCVRSDTNYEARIRAAWSAYNGGGAKLCRWTNSNDTWAQNDVNFYEHLVDKPYEKFVASAGKASSVNVPCLMEKQENCPARDPAGSTGLQPGILYQAADGRSCVINAGKAYCVDQVRDAICLNSITGFTGKAATPVETAQLNKYSPMLADRHRLCAAYDPTLLGVGTSLETRKDINLRATPGGGLLALVPANTSLQILDFELRSAPLNERYYKVKYGTQTGYVYGGVTSDATTWVVSSTDAAYKTLANVGESVKIVNSSGINLRATAGGTLMLTIPVNTNLKVSGVSVVGSENGVYYKVTFQGKTGYIYSGLLLPINSTAQWTQVLR